MKKLTAFLKEEFVLVFFFVLTLFLSFIYPHEIKNYLKYIDKKTIFILLGLLIITSAIKESGYLDKLSKKILNTLSNERQIAFFLVGLSIILSMFFTNDITLFIVIPLTFSIQNAIKNDLTKLIILEAISVNVGSLLTPIGNPQNIFLWHNWKISFFSFVWQMLPLEILLLTLLFIFVWILFPAKTINFSQKAFTSNNSSHLFFISLIFLLLYIIFLDSKVHYFLLVIIILYYLIFYPKLFFITDWLLILLFIFIFIDFSIISKQPFILKAISFFDMQTDKTVYTFSAIISQIISNVPGAVFMSKFSSNWKAITYGVNIAGNGFVLGSLANIIALRMTKNKRIWFDFHRYSIPYFLFSAILTYIIFFR